ncbi:MAG: FAD-dependent oxidoreductase [Bryobacterales bacterium]|nr:FAD-dependent oxidoreductase [Bryobacterales bacterium]
MEPDRPLVPSRRRFLSAALVGLSQKSGRAVTGSFVLESHEAGHRLRDRAFAAMPAREQRVPLVIVGGGIAGLCAAWRLRRRGFRDFVVLEMEDRAGGNARWGENEISQYPWAAHYVPVPGPGPSLARELFEELGLFEDGEPSERHLCFSPQERLFLQGRWQEGLEPAGTPKDIDQYKRFSDRMADFRANGAFRIPAGDSLRLGELDRLSMRDWLLREGFDSSYLQWYCDYSCRDDYGCSSADASAWAGIHYFAAREDHDPGPFTWPEGNGWLVKRLLERVGTHVRTGATVCQAAREKNRWRIVTKEIAYVSDAVIFAAPTFLAPFLIEDMPAPQAFEYSPWVTANLTLDRLPRERGVPLAWDNVIFNSPSLGYVVATHQSLASRIERSVWTYYWALADGEPAARRRDLLASGWNRWKEAILDDLTRAHPDIRECVSRIDILRLGHAMIRPSVGFLTSQARRKFTAYEADNFWFANSDLSGISIFEEAQYRGVTAADRALARISK